ncbi:MAG: PH domain-containing protein [Acidimicrobiia bacterium]|nr:PH domain-containing protein [Acidimicrobiia bacterium]
MAFPDSILTDDEVIIRQFRPHWRMLAIPVLWFIGGIVAIVLVYQVLPPENGTADLITTLLVLLAMIFLVVSPLLKWWFTIYVLTSERLITRTGIIARSGIELPLQNINNVLFNQNILERMLQSGDLLIESAGESGQSEFSNIPRPEEFQSLLYRTREEQSRKTAAEESAIAADLTRDPTEQLERAARLHRDGVLSDEEFAAMKDSILGGSDS